MNAACNITTFWDGYFWCSFINGDFFGRFRTQMEAWGEAAAAIERLRAAYR